MRWLFRLILLLIVLGLLAALAAWYFPASLAYRLAGDRLIGSGLVAQNLSGTVRQGRAGDVYINGFPIGSFGWTMDWRGLFRRDVGAEWRLDGPAWGAEGQTTRMADGSLLIRGMRMNLPALLLKPVLDIPALNFLGKVEVELDHVRLRGLIIEEARGNARWVDAGTTGQAQTRFGPVLANFVTQRPGHIIGEVQDQGGPLMVDGQFELIATQYRAEVILRSRNMSDPITQMLHYVGQAMPDGGSLLIVEGELQRHADQASAQ